MKATPTTRRALLGTVLAVGTLGASGCVPLLIGGGATGAVLVAADRRTSGMQLEDERIEQKFSALVREQMPEAGRLIATSFNRIVLLTGEVRNAADKAQAQALLQSVEHVRSVVNELQIVSMVSALSQRTKDAFITSKVKASLIDAKDLQANTIKVITEQQVVYLMGLLTAREAQRAAEIAHGVNDVHKVVRVFEVITEEELAGYQTPAAQSQATPTTTAPVHTDTNLQTAPPSDAGVVVQPVR